MIVAGMRLAIALLPILIVLVALLVRAAFRIQRLVNRLSSPVHRHLVLRHYSLSKLILRTGCMIGAVVLLWCAVARIQYESDEVKPTHEQGRDLLIALDISRSMLANDCSPNRLVCAQRKIRSLLQRLHSERVGLIVFSGAAFVQCPLTKDFGSFELFLNALDAESMTHASTDIASALQTALQTCEQQPDRKNKLLVIFTDGEDFSADLSSMQERAHELGLRVCTMGLGTPEGAPIPLYDQQGVLQGHLQDDAGAVVMSRLDERTLEHIAQKLSGWYVRADDTSDADIDHLCNWVATFDTETFATTTAHSYRETFFYFAAAALALLLLGRFL